MVLRRISPIIPFLTLAILLAACNGNPGQNSGSNEAQDEKNSSAFVNFKAEDPLDYEVMILSNYKKDVIYLDYENTFQTGFIIPSANQTPSGFFEFNFNITNKSGKAQKYFYKLYYQNESYKFEEILQDGSYNPLCEENFYGSYETDSTGFKPTKVLQPGEKTDISDRLRIMGNPRNEEQYFGSTQRFMPKIPKEQIRKRAESIKKNKEWFEMIVEKARNNGIDTETQLLMDAQYMIEMDHKKGNSNNRWKRNPRAGKYQFMVVILPASSLHEIPEYIQHIDRKKDSIFVNPFYYFRHGEGSQIKDISFAKTGNLLHLINKVPMTAGVWIPSSNIYKKPFDTSYYNSLLNNSENLFNEASFQLYENYRSQEDSVYNVPVVADFFGKGYTLEEYEKNAQIPKSERIPIIFENTKAPGKNIKVDTTENCLRISNPGCTLENPAKVNAGVITRHGFTYGKITVKVKFTELLTEGLVWNGITDAFWLITESLEKWNGRRICNDQGYMPYYGAPREAPRVPQISYTEIDFEIVKAAETWPNYYPDGTKRDEPASNIDKIMVTCTNWDMACPQPSDFGVGVHYIEYDDKQFIAQRWDEYYNAVTQKVPEKDDELFKTDYYYFQIEWKPREILWRIGPERDQLRLIGYLNENYTSVPNNQMKIIFTQEYHFSHWWPKSPFKQEDVPFPANDMEGVIYEITIE
ncbi:MAG: hypothetical protein KDC05_05490 [Bacteroidales bacterium]|nr:hypothetical protein [Bacteroidales bacterium]